MMNAIVIAILIALGIVSVRSIIRRLHGDCGCEGGASSPLRIEPQDKNRSHYGYEALIAVEGMTCKGCALKVANALNGQDGVWADKVNLKAKTAHVLLKEALPDERLAAPITDAGYRVGSIERTAI